MAATWCHACLATILFAVGFATVSRDEQEPTPTITLAELTKLGVLMDADRDGFITEEELFTMRNRMNRVAAQRDARHFMKLLDHDDDGFVSEDELTSTISAANKFTDNILDHADYQRIKFKAADVDNDGKLSIPELASFARPETNAAVLLTVTSHTMETKDSDHDGKLSIMEFWSDADHQEYGISDLDYSVFGYLDTDADKYLDISELTVFESGELAFRAAEMDLEPFVQNKAFPTDSLSLLMKLKGSDFHYHLAEWIDYLKYIEL